MNRRASFEQIQLCLLFIHPRAPNLISLRSAGCAFYLFIRQPHGSEVSPVTYYVLVVIELSSRKVPKRLINETCSKQGIVSGQLTLHADRGTSMKSKPLAMLLSDLGVTKTHSRPHVSNDNPYSESQFKTLKYRPEFPKRFGSIQHARDVCRDLFSWYNTEHYHSGIGLLTPESGALRPGGDDRRRSQAGALGLLRSPSGAFCEGNAETARNTLSGVDQSTDDENDASDGRTSQVRDLGRPTGTPHLHHLRGSRRLRLGPPQ